MRPEDMTPLTNARSQFFLATHVCLLENANGCGHNTSPPWFLIKSSIACSWTSMSQHLPTSISHTKLEIATYIHELADKLLPSTTSQYILLGTTQLAPATTLHYNSQYYFVLQNLHKVLPSTTLYYKACTKSFPVCYNLLLQNRISTPKQEKDDFEAFLKRNFKWKITSAKFAKICWQMTIAAWMQPLQYDLQSSAAKDNSITHAAAAASNLEAATPMRSAETELQITIELSATASEIAAPKPDLDAKAKKRRFWSIF